MAIQYEDFQPLSEWKEEEKSHVLLVQLHNFTREQLKITHVQASRIIRVSGERQLTRNKRSRFNQPFSVPENCDASKIHATFQSGVLTITIPKLPTVAQSSPKEDAKSTLQEAPTPPISTTAPSGIGKEGHEKPMTSETSQRPTMEPKAQKGMEETARLASRKEMDGKKVEAPMEPKPQKSLDDAPSKVASDFDAVKQRDEKKSMVSGDKVVVDERKEKSEAKEKAMEPAKEKSLFDKDQEISKKRKESVATETEETSKKRKESVMPGNGIPAAIKTMEKVQMEKRDKPTGTVEKSSTEEFISQRVKEVKNMASAAKKSVEELTTDLSEESKSLISLGVAVLVVAALGAYITYKYGASRSTRN